MKNGLKRLNPELPGFALKTVSFCGQMKSGSDYGLANLKLEGLAVVKTILR